jgi:beta-phosphoglucomutase-like phosphatase (HAD superfamily)
MPLDIMRKIQAVIFDLDGVIVDTAQFHFIAWKELGRRVELHANSRRQRKAQGG